MAARRELESLLPSPTIELAREYPERLERLVHRVAAAVERREGAGGAHLAGGLEEFAGYRPYRPGEDLRALDWDLLARLDRAFVRIGRREAVEEWCVVVDTSASMGVGRPGKLQLAGEVAGAFAALGARQGASVELLATGDLTRPPLRLDRRAQLGSWLAQMAALRATGDVGIAAALRTGALAGRVARAGRVVLLGDAFELAPAEVAGLRRRGRELWVVACHAREELTPRPDEPVEWVDPEDGERLRVAASRRGVAAYETALDALVEGWRVAAARHRFAFVAAAADEPFEHPVQALWLS